MNTAKLRLAVLSDKTVKGSVRRICESLIEIADNVPEHNLSLISIEKLTPFDSDIAVKAFVANEKRVISLKDMGISEAVDTILKESGVAKYPHIKSPISNFKTLSQRSSDYMIVESFLGSMRNFLWDPVIHREYTAIAEKFNELREEVTVKKHIDLIASSRNRTIYRGLLEKLDNYVFDRSSNSRRFIIQELDKYKFDSNINTLANALKVLENEDGGFNPLSNSTKCTVRPAVGFVQINEKEDYFLLDGIIYKKEGDAMSFVEEKEAIRNCSSLLEVSAALKRTGAYILNDSIMIPMGKGTIRISESGDIFINEEHITKDQLIHKATIASVVDPSQIRVIRDAVVLFENASKLMEIDFAKTITSNIYEGVKAHIVKGDNYLVNFRNPAMNESKTVNFVNARNLKNYIMDKLSYDVSEAFTEVLTREESRIIKQREKVNSLMESVVAVEKELKKVKQAIMEDTSVSENRNVRMLEKSLSSELKILKKTYHQEQLRLDEMLGTSSMPSVGDKVKVGKSGVGTVLSVDSVNRLAIVMMEDGHTVKCKHNECTVIDPSVKKSKSASPEVTMSLIKGSTGTPSSKKTGKGKSGYMKESLVETDIDSVETVDIDDVEGIGESPELVSRHPEFGDVYDEDKIKFREMVQRGSEDYNPSEYDEEEMMDDEEEMMGYEDEYGHTMGEDDDYEEDTEELKDYIENPEEDQDVDEGQWSGTMFDDEEYMDDEDEDEDEDEYIIPEMSPEQISGEEDEIEFEEEDDDYAMSPQHSEEFGDLADTSYDDAGYEEDMEEEDDDMTYESEEGDISSDDEEEMKMEEEAEDEEETETGE